MLERVGILKLEFPNSDLSAAFYLFVRAWKVYFNPPQNYESTEMRKICFPRLEKSNSEEWVEF